jgi:uncharacterized protein (TIGR02001 family)
LSPTGPAAARSTLAQRSPTHSTTAIAPARFSAPRARVSAHSLIGLVVLGFATPASAEFGAAVSAYNDWRFRGYTLSSAHPYASLDLSYDDPSGFYVGATGALIARDGVHPLAIQLNGGYARRLPSGVSLDAGIVHSRYSNRARGHFTSYTEVYAGASYKFLSSHIYYSPHYFEPGFQSVYGEVEATVRPAKHLSVTAHAGMLVWLRVPDDGYVYRNDHDWRLGVTREFGRLAIHANVSGGGPEEDYYNYYPNSRTRFVAGVSYAL